MKTKAATGASLEPFDAFLQAGGTWMPMPAQFLEGWQRQMNASLRIMDAMLESALKVRDAQLPAASEGLARVAELQKSLLDAKTPLDLWTVQCNWMIENATRAMAFWKGIYDAANVANANLCACLREEAQPAGAPGARAIGRATVSAPAGSVATQDLVKTALVTFDAAYGQMLKSSQQIMAAAAEALSGGRRATSAGSGSASKGGGT